MCCLGVPGNLDMPTIWGGRGAQGGQIHSLGIYYGVTRSERYGALVGQSEDWTTLPVWAPLARLAGCMVEHGIEHGIGHGAECLFVCLFVWFTVFQ